MSLLDRVERAVSQQVTCEERFAKDDLIREMRERLYEQLPASEIARLISSDERNARREVWGALEMVSRKPEFHGAPTELLDECMRDILDFVIGLGPLERLIEDVDVTEIMVNGPGNVFYEKGGKLHPSEMSFSDEGQLRAVIDKILGPAGRRVDEQSPMVSARLSQGHRVNVVVSPIAIDGPFVTIRKFKERIFSLEELVDIGTMDSDISDFLKSVVRSRKNIAVSGGTGSGKTTLLNALSLEIPKDERIVTIEDSAELRFQDHPNIARMESRPASIEGTGEITIRQMVTNALRMRPDRIIVGECRGAEALDMLQAMNTGHDGSMTTLHANSTREVATRLVMMVRFGSELPVEVIEQQIASALSFIVHLERKRDGNRKLVEISRCEYVNSSIGFCPVVTWDAQSESYVWREVASMCGADGVEEGCVRCL